MRLTICLLIAGLGGDTMRVPRVSFLCKRRMHSEGRKGFLLVEIMIAIALLLSIACVVIHYQIAVTHMQYDARQKTTIVHAMSHIIECMHATKTIPKEKIIPIANGTITVQEVPCLLFDIPPGFAPGYSVVINLIACWHDSRQQCHEWTITTALRPQEIN